MKPPRFIAHVMTASPFSMGFLILLSLSAPAAHAGSFYGHECSADCDRLQAGYEWARSEGVVSAEGCTGDAPFAEGCRAFLENNDAAENAQAVGVAPDSEPITDQEDYQGSAQGGEDDPVEQGSSPGFAPANTPDDMGNYDDAAPDDDYENYDPDSPDQRYDDVDTAPAAGDEPPASR